MTEYAARSFRCGFRRTYRPRVAISWFRPAVRPSQFVTYYITTRFGPLAGAIRWREPDTGRFSPATLAM